MREGHRNFGNERGDLRIGNGAFECKGGDVSVRALIEFTTKRGDLRSWICDNCDGVPGDL